MNRVKIVLLIGLAALGAVYAGTRPEDMTREEKHKLVVKVAIGAMNAGDWEGLRELYSPRYVQHSPGESEPATWTDFELACRVVHNKLPGLRFEIEDIIAEGNKVAVRLRWSYKNKRWFSMRGNPDGDIEGTEIDLYRIEDGRIVEEWCECDPKQFMRLLRVIKYMED